MTTWFARSAAFLALAVAFVAPQGAHASTLEIQFLGLDMIYDGTDLYDARSIAGGVGSFADADPLTAVKFMVDGSVLGTLSTNIASDFVIQDALNIPAGGGGVVSLGNGDSFGFDLLTSPTGFGLGLNIDTASVFYAGGQVFVSGGGVAAGLAIQALPFDLTIDTSKPITFAFSSANLTDVVTANGILKSFRASGTGNIRATLVPEPASASLVSLGALAALAAGRRRR